MAKWCKSVLQVTGWGGTCRTLDISEKSRLGLVFCLKSTSVKSPADSGTIIQAGKSHSVMIKFVFFVTVIQSVSPQCTIILHKKRGWFNPLWLLQLRIAFTKLNRIRNWADTFSNVSCCHSATAQLGKNTLKKLSKITDLGDYNGNGWLLPHSRNYPLPPPWFLLWSHNTKHLIVTKEAYQSEVRHLVRRSLCWGALCSIEAWKCQQSLCRSLKE